MCDSLLWAAWCLQWTLNSMCPVTAIKSSLCNEQYMWHFPCSWAKNKLSFRRIDFLQAFSLPWNAQHMVELDLPALSWPASIKQIFFCTDANGNPSLKLAENFGLELQKKQNPNSPIFLILILHYCSFCRFSAFFSPC